MTARSRREDVAPYSVLSTYYNQVMNHVDYRGWARFIDKLAIEKHNLNPGRAIDFACGTGEMLRYLARLGWDTIGVDGSAQMVAEARKIQAPSRRRMEWGVSDFLSVPKFGQADLGICVYDSVNYLLEDKEVSKFFENASKVIRKGGLLVFDLSTEINSRMHFDGSILEEQVRGAAYRRVTRYDEEERIQHNVFNIYPDDEDVVYVEHHQQRIYPIKTVIDIALARGFKSLAVYHEMTFRKGDEMSDRVHVVTERL